MKAWPYQLSFRVCMGVIFALLLAMGGCTREFAKKEAEVKEALAKMTYDHKLAKAFQEGSAKVCMAYASYLLNKNEPPLSLSDVATDEYLGKSLQI